MIAGHHAYTETDISTSSPARLVLALYDGAVNYTLRAKRSMEEGDMARKGELIGRSMDVITELMNSLDMAAGGEMAVNLNRLYAFCLDRLMDASIKKEPARLDAVVRVLSTLREGWEEVINAESGGLINRR